MKIYEILEDNEYDYLSEGFYSSMEKAKSIGFKRIIKGYEKSDPETEHTISDRRLKIRCTYQGDKLITVYRIIEHRVDEK